MNRFLPVIFLALLALLVFLVPLIHASSQQAYQDYLYQFDVYRQKNVDFQVAKNEYLKFKTLTSQATALDKTKAMLSQRDLLLRAYLLLLNEKINEIPDFAGSDRNLYQTLIRNEVTFLENHSKLVDSVASLDDAGNVSGQLVSHYQLLQASVRQTIIGITTGNLSHLANLFDTDFTDAKALVNANRGAFSPQKQATLDRWILQITNTRSLYQQKIDGILPLMREFTGRDIGGQNELFGRIMKELELGRQYLLEGSSNLTELATSLKYED